MGDVPANALDDPLLGIEARLLSVLGYLSERLSLPLAVVAIAGFLVGLSSSGLVVGLSIMGLVYIVLTPVVIWLSARGKPRGSRVAESFVGAVWLLMALYVCFIERPGSMTHFDIEAVIGVGAVAVVTARLAIKLPADYQRTHKACPECANMVLEKARVCHYCAYRWEPPLDPRQPVGQAGT
ncbi:MAG: hypothetical protein ACJ76D_07970 [Solirubrobacterales bacterium]